MDVGVVREIKALESRVGLVPASVRELTRQGHVVYVEEGAGEGSGFTDQDYQLAGALLLPTAADVFDKATMIVKVKEPQLVECAMLKPHHILFTYLHLAPDRAQALALLESGCTAIAYETVTHPKGGLPLLTPMSMVAGRMAVQAGAHCLEKPQGGRGVLLGGVPGVAPANVLVIGGGVVGTHAIRMAIGMEAAVTVLDKSVDRLAQLDAQFGAALNTIFATTEAIEAYACEADLVIGAVLVPGASAPKLIERKQLHRMRPGAVIVDVAIDQGGCFETSRPTTHDTPTFVEEGIVHYCVANMPGAAPRTSALALNNATLPYVLQLANSGLTGCLTDADFKAGVNVRQGHITHPAVAEALDIPYVAPDAESVFSVVHA